MRAWRVVMQSSQQYVVVVEADSADEAMKSANAKAGDRFDAVDAMEVVGMGESDE